mgnify:CR=1 FL=1
MFCFRVCDGDFDCPGATEENNCTTCPDDRPVKCQGINSTKCIVERDICDGSSDCEDNLDESDCKNKCPSFKPFKCPGQSLCLQSQVLVKMEKKIS